MTIILSLLVRSVIRIVTLMILKEVAFILITNAIYIYMRSWKWSQKAQKHRKLVTFGLSEALEFDKRTL